MTSDRRDNYTPGFKYNFWELRVSELWVVWVGGGTAAAEPCFLSFSTHPLCTNSPGAEILKLCSTAHTPPLPDALPPHCHRTVALLLQGVPLRVELGPKDMIGGCVMLARRDTGVKESVAWGDLAARVPALLLQIQVPAPAALPLPCPDPPCPHREGGCCEYCGRLRECLIRAAVADRLRMPNAAFTTRPLTPRRPLTPVPSSCTAACPPA